MIKLLDKVVIQHTKDGVVEKNLATGESRLAVQSDYAKENKLKQPERENCYRPPQERAEHCGREEKPARKPPTDRRKVGERPVSSVPVGTGTPEEPDAAFPKSGEPRRPDLPLGRSGPEEWTRKERKAASYREPSASGGSYRSSRRTRPGERGRFSAFARQRVLNRIGDRLRSRKSEEKEDNLGIQTVKSVSRAAGRLGFGVHSIRKLTRKYSRRAAEKAAESPKKPFRRTAERGARTVRAADAAVSPAARAGKAAGKVFSRPALSKFFLAVAAVFLSILFLCTLLGGASGSFLGSATEHPELTAYVRQLDSDFLTEVEAVKAAYEKKGDDVVLEGGEFVNTDAGALAILVTQDWTDLSLTPENKAKLAKYHAVLNTYAVSAKDETVTDGKTKKIISHVKIVIRADTPEEKIDAFGFSSAVRAHVLDMLSILRQIEAENGDAGAVGGGSCTVSAKVLSYRPMVERYCAKYGISDYVNLVLAVMQQESGGFGNDPLQCSECPDNRKYPNVPNGITDPEYSVQVGIEYLSGCLRAAGCKSPGDIPGISLALQGQNYGNGYIPWAKARGGYSLENAKEFSQIEAASHGWSGYGDPQYVPHVMRYYSAASGSGSFLPPLKSGTYTISRGWGYDGGEFHKGIDFAAPSGTKIYASAAGTVLYAQFGSPPYGGYGNVVVIQHSGKLSTLYGHCSRLLVSAGQTVRQGQLIALVGNTGRSEGNHCHFEIRVNGNKVNPEPYLKGVLKK